MDHHVVVVQAVAGGRRCTHEAAEAVSRICKSLYGDIAIHSLDEFHDTFEIGITLARSNQHRGIAREAVMRVLDHLFTSANAYRVTANCDTRNAPVAKLLTAVGMNKESTEADVEFSKGEWITLDSYAILKREFLRSPDTVAPG